DRLAQGVDHAPDEALADRHFHDAPGGARIVAFGDVAVLAHDHRADRVALEVQRQAEGIAGEFDHLALHHVGQAVDAHDAVGESHDRAFGAGRRRALELLDARADEFADLGRIQLLHDESLVTADSVATPVAPGGPWPIR